MSHIRPLFLSSDGLWGSSGYRVYHSQDGGQTWHAFSHLPTDGVSRALAAHETTRSASRLGFHSLARLEGGDFVGVVKGAIVMKRHNAPIFRKVVTIENGSRPLNLCVAPSGILFGEYFSNRKRDPVRVFHSQDGTQWGVALEFPRGAVRHIHGVYWDDVDNQYLIATGDFGSEAGLWACSPDFSDVFPVMHGDQQSRVVQVFPFPEAIVVATDAPGEANHIYRIERRGFRREAIAELAGPVIHGAMQCGAAVVSTVVEPGTAKKDPARERAVCVYSTSTADSWKKIGEYRAMWGFSGLLGGYMGYPTVMFPQGDRFGTAPPTWLYGYGRFLKGVHGRLIRWQGSEIS